MVKSAREVVVVSATRTAIGSYGGLLKDVAPITLATEVIKAAIAKAGVSPGDVGHVCMGHVIQTEARDIYLARVAALEAGCSQETPAFNVNRLCGSGLQALISASQAVFMGDCDTAIAGGAESMSRALYASSTPRFGKRMGDFSMVDMMLGALQDPFHGVHMGVTAENVAARHSVSREEQDRLALQSHARAARAQDEGRFAEQITPISVPGRKGGSIVDRDEHVRRDVHLDALASLKPAFDPKGTVTAGNSSGLNDGAAALVLMEKAHALAQGVKPMARLVAYAHAGVEPLYMGLGPVPASRLALKRAGLRASDIAVIESNEAFAAQACAVQAQLGLDTEKVNPNGSGIALGHPVGATGAIIAVKALHELKRVEGRFALVTMCIGGGQGIAAIFERME